MIDERAIIHPSAKIADNVEIGPYAYIGPNVELGEGCWVSAHGFIKANTRMGKNNKVYQFTSIGEDPQDLKYKGEETFLEVGDNNIFREFCTIDRGTAQDKGYTKIGNNNLFMNYVHIAHDCVINNHVIFSNNASLAGHVIVDDFVILGGFAAIYQFCHLGEHAFISSGSMVEKDVLPFTRVSNKEIFAKPFGLNVVGLRRRGFSQEKRSLIKRAYRAIYREGLTTEQAIAKLEELRAELPEVSLFVDMLKTAKFGILR